MIAKYNLHIVLIVLGALFFLPFLGYVHLFDWDEINFAESSREMMITGNYFQNQINFEPFWEKPPFFFWLQSVSMTLFGHNEFGARFPNALFGIISLLFIFNIGKRLYNERFGLMWALLFLGSLLPHLYFKSGIIDPVFNLFIFASLYFLIRTVQESYPKAATKFAVISGLLIGLAVITKGPVGLLLLFLTVTTFWILNRFKPLTTIKNVILFTLMALLVSFFWFGYETIKNGPWFLSEFISYQIELFTGAEGGAAAGHQQPFYYHFVVILIGCFPISFIAFGNLFGSKYLVDKFQFRRWMNILFWVVLILFSIVSTKIVHYSSLAYLPLSFMATYYLYQCDIRKEKFKKWITILIGFVGILLSLVVIAIPLLVLNKENWVIPNIGDQFIKDALTMELSWGWLDFIPGVVLLLFVIIGVFQLARKNVFRFTILNAIGMGMFLLSTSIIILPKVEQYSQGPAIEFYKTLENQDVYILPLKHKSYGHYFYAKTQPLGEGDGLFTKGKEQLSLMGKSSFGELKGRERLDYNSALQSWLINDEIDKDAYFIIKAKDYSSEHYPSLEVIMQEGGFIGLKRNRN